MFVTNTVAPSVGGFQLILSVGELDGICIALISSAGPATAVKDQIFNLKYHVTIHAHSVSILPNDFHGFSLPTHMVVCR